MIFLTNLADIVRFKVKMSHNIQPLLNKNYIKAVSSKGIYIYDETGKEYIDGSSGAITCSLGHGHEKVIELVKKQAEKLIYVYRSQFGSQESERLALSCMKNPKTNIWNIVSL